MKIYIIWNKDYSDINSHHTHIIDVCKTKNDVLSKYKIKKINEAEDNHLVCEFGLANGDYKDYCATIEINDDTKKLYFLKINEDGGAQSYHSITWIYVFMHFDDIIERTLDYFSEEHNRNDDCKKCAKKFCEKKLINGLKNNGCAYIDSDEYESIDINVWDLDLKLL